MLNRDEPAEYRLDTLLCSAGAQLRCGTQAFYEFDGRHRAVQQVALTLVAPVRCGELDLGRGLDAFRHRAERANPYRQVNPDALAAHCSPAWQPLRLAPSAALRLPGGVDKSAIANCILPNPFP